MRRLTISAKPKTGDYTPTPKDGILLAEVKVKGKRIPPIVKKHFQVLHELIHKLPSYRTPADATLVAPNFRRHVRISKPIHIQPDRFYTSTGHRIDQGTTLHDGLAISGHQWEQIDYAQRRHKTFFQQLLRRHEQMVESGEIDAYALEQTYLRATPSNHDIPVLKEMRAGFERFHKQSAMRAKQEQLDPVSFALSNDPIIKGIAGAVVIEGVGSALAASQFFALSGRGALTRMGTDATLQLIFNKGDYREIDWADVGTGAITLPELGALSGGMFDLFPFREKDKWGIVGYNKSYSSAFIDAGVGYLGGKASDALGGLITPRPYRMGPTGFQTIEAFVVYPSMKTASSMATQSITEMLNKKYEKAPDEKK